MCAWMGQAVGKEKLEKIWHDSTRGIPKEHYEGIAWCDLPAADGKGRDEALKRAARHRMPRCACYENRGGYSCDAPVPSFCLNQCSGRGRCERSFCVCDHGWTGSDCSVPLLRIGRGGRVRAADELRRARAARRGKGRGGGDAGGGGGGQNGGGVRGDAGDGSTGDAPAAASSSTDVDPTLVAARRRPAIYVYELPVKFNAWLHETRMHPQVRDLPRSPQISTFAGIR